MADKTPTMLKEPEIPYSQYFAYLVILFMNQLDDLDKVCCDALLHELDKENNQPWINVYTKAGVSKSRADYLYKILNTDGFITSIYKGDSGKVDSHIVSMTERGKAFFAKKNYVDELRVDGQFKVEPPSLFSQMSYPILVSIIIILIGYFLLKFIFFPK